ncbi:carbohydrate ABC transporter permease [Robinsoniella sp. KNHs210]|uniref:carbohydrate ABC transporter permease n=1 Tax=Robinsoniella sp. KNHs210 TaxID=1469950 RepID=UPI0005C7C7D9|nr:carbohydrate ABC transporter permease [Robinsoniella sp. KNHs210]
MARQNVGGKTKIIWMKIFLLVFFTLLAIVILVPFAAMVIASFKDGKELIQYGLNLKIEPDKMGLKNYVYLFTGEHSYFTWFINSVFLTVVQVVLTLLVSACVGYGFAAYNFKGKNFFFVCVLLILMVPFEILMLPLYNQMIGMKLSNTYTGIVLPFMANASTIFFFRQYLEGIPKELISAGRVDGATEYGIFVKLIFPIMKPAMASMAILNGMTYWNNFLWPLLILRDDKKYTLPIGLNTLLTPYGNNYDLLIVGSCFSVIPILILFLCFQKYFIEGMVAGAVKG